jgi:hypothetical protein
MPQVAIDPAELARFGARWTSNGGRLTRTRPESSMELTEVFDNAVGSALAEMLGGIPIKHPSSTSLTPPDPNCVEVGPVRVIGGVRPQNFDVGYRPDGLRFAFDSKTLNDTKSVNKNWQNMVNDIATEATTVHTRFPHAVVAFLVAFPTPCISERNRKAITETLERLARRYSVVDPDHLAEAITLLFWDPTNGRIDAQIPALGSPLRLEKLSESIYNAYSIRYRGLPPHVEVDVEEEPGAHDLPQ